MHPPRPGDGEKKTKKRPYEEVKIDKDEEDDDDDDDDEELSKISPEEPPQTTDLIRALQELENAASGDAAVHQRISSLPVEVQDVSLLDKITDKASGDQLSKMVDDACMLLADYNGRLAAEIDDRKQLTRMLSDFLQSQKEVLEEKEQQLEGWSRIFITVMSGNGDRSLQEENAVPRNRRAATALGTGIGQLVVIEGDMNVAKYRDNLTQTWPEVHLPSRQ
ncbi:unnamed protein product [Ranitomeya imitator]|uniref:RPRD1A/B C-terminal domain-containing protein n=1 Tax=Ranitomeya imitator TaxID=111125 RepID=A0ABN9M1C0_9NEOB|nr:unnamed protein product [Ranitomeya imitator]